MPLERFEPRAESPHDVQQRLEICLELRGLSLRDKRLTREALLLVTGPVQSLALQGAVSCHAAPTAHLVTRRGKVGTR